MASKTTTPRSTTPYNDPPGLGPRKTLFVLVTVVGCIAILWPKIFYPMMFGGSAPTDVNKDLKGDGKYRRQCLSKSIFPSLRFWISQSKNTCENK